MGELPRRLGAAGASRRSNAAGSRRVHSAIQRCEACGTLQHPPEEVCHACGAMRVRHRGAGATGTCTATPSCTTRRNPALGGAVPYTVVLVALDDAPHIRVVGNVQGEVAIGMPVEAGWDEREADDGTVIRLPRWRAFVQA